MLCLMFYACKLETRVELLDNFEMLMKIILVLTNTYLYFIYHISSIRRLDVNHQIVSFMPGVKRSTGVNLNVEF